MKKKNPADEAFLGRLKKEAPEVLEVEVDFDIPTLRILKAKVKPRTKTTKKSKRKVS